MEGGPLVLSHCSSSISCSKLHPSLYQNTSMSSLPHRQSFLPSFSSSSSNSSSLSSSTWHPMNLKPWVRQRIQNQLFVSGARAGPVTVKESETTPSSLASGKDDEAYALPKLDKNGRFCSPRAARELALSIVYASCLDGQDPVRLFEKRMNAPKESGYVFDKSSLLRYDYMRFGGPPVTTSTVEEADQLLSEIEAESAIEVEVLSAPLKLVYSKLLLRFTKKLLGAVVDKWDNHVLVIDKVAPPHWKMIMNFNMKAVDLAKRFCDGSAPRVINGCLRSFVQDQS